MTEFETEGIHRFAYEPPVIRYGHNAVTALRHELSGRGLDRALVICGRSVGSNPDAIDPVVEALDDRLVGVFDKTTQEKHLATAFDALERARAADVDVLVALGGGSSLDVARVASALSTTDRPTSAVYSHFMAQGTVPLGASSALPVVVIPTTLAGADLSDGAGITVHPSTDPVSEPRGGGIRDPRLMPVIAIYDPHLVASTPRSALVGSAMNGFDKGLEAIYAPNGGPVTAATATAGLQLLVDALPRLEAASAIDPVVRGTMLVQYGTARTDGTTLSLIHAFGHGLTATVPVQQGVAHAVMAPHVLRHLFEQAPAGRHRLAEALGVADDTASDAAIAEAVVTAVAELRDQLGLPRRLRAIDDLARADLDAVARRTAADGLASNVPADVDTSASAVQAVLEAAW